MAKPDVPAALLNVRWIHAHEEDTPEQMVFRPSGWSLPPSRGRACLELKEDGSVRREMPGPTDRAVACSVGTWRRAPDGGISVLGAAAQPLTLASVTKDRLVLRRPG